MTVCPHCQHRHDYGSYCPLCLRQTDDVEVEQREKEEVQQPPEEGWRFVD